jgi:capsid protein
VTPEQIPAKFILHWWMLRRPGAHRGVPEFKSTLNVGASSRRWREATVAAAETAADFAALLKTQMSPDDGADAAAPFSTIDFTKRMMTALPMGWEAQQMKAEHPNAQYEAFLRTQINEQARPKSIPYNLAACDSSSYNYASGRLDHQTYFSALDIERADCDDLVLDPLFARWWELAVPSLGWNADPLDPPQHLWDWPQHPVADLKNEASSVDMRLRNGSLSPSEVASQSGADYEDRVQLLANDYGVTVEEMRAILLKATFAAQAQGEKPPAEDEDATDTEPEDDEEDEADE